MSRRCKGREKIDGHDAYVVMGRREGKTPLRFILTSNQDCWSGWCDLGETPLGRLPTQIDYADYREAGGVKIPFRWTLARPSGRFTIQVSDVKQNVPVDDAKFAKPAAASGGTERAGEVTAVAYGGYVGEPLPANFR